MTRRKYWIAGVILVIATCLLLNYLRQEKAAYAEYKIWLKWRSASQNSVTFEEFKVLKRIDGLWR